MSFLFISFSFCFLCLIFFELLVYLLQFMPFFHCSLTSEFISSFHLKNLEKIWKIIKMDYGKLRLGGGVMECVHVIQDTDQYQTSVNIKFGMW